MRAWRWRWAAISAACPAGAFAAVRFAGIGHPAGAAVGFSLLAVGIVCGVAGMSRNESWGWSASCLGLLVNGFLFACWGALVFVVPLPRF